MTKQFAMCEQDSERFIILSVAKDLTKVVDVFEHCEVPRRLCGSG